MMSSVRIVCVLYLTKIRLVVEEVVYRLQVKTLLHFRVRADDDVECDYAQQK